MERLNRARAQIKASFEEIDRLKTEAAGERELAARALEQAREIEKRTERKLTEEFEAALSSEREKTRKAQAEFERSRSAHAQAAAQVGEMERTLADYRDKMRAVAGQLSQRLEATRAQVKAATEETKRLKTEAAAERELAAAALEQSRELEKSARASLESQYQRLLEEERERARKAQADFERSRSAHAQAAAQVGEMERALADYRDKMRTVARQLTERLQAETARRQELEKKIDGQES